MAGVLRRSLFFAVLLAFAWPARADPLLKFLFTVAREIALNQVQAPAAVRVEVPATYPGTTVEPALLKRLIDDSFGYLSEAQRAEVFDALNAELLKPGNAAVRGPTIEFFAHRALQVRAAQQHLARLSDGEKERLAREFREEAKTLSPEDASQLRQALEKGLLPVPSDLGERLLAALD